MESLKLFIPAFSGFIFWTLTFVLIVMAVNKEVPSPYMDEIFHVDQMRRYCAGNFSSWNNKITTPPGLYVISLIILKPVISYFSKETVCSVQVLRFLNPGFLTLIFPIAVAMLRHQSCKQQRKLNVIDQVLAGIAVSMFPLCFFTSLLFYTDTLSVLFVILMYHLCQLHLSVFGALSGMCACFMRQTNIIWVLFCTGLTVERVAEEFIQVHVDQRSKDQPNKSVHRRAGARTIVEFVSEVLEISRQKPTLFWQMIAVVFAKTAPFFMLCGGFALFVVTNGGLALGDKSAHEVVLNIPQLYYWTGFTVAFGSPFVLVPGNILMTLKSIFQRKLLFLGTVGFLWFGVHFFTYDHPYLLADNRHYTFYIWKNWFRRHWIMKYLLIPGYLFAVHSLADSVKHKSGIWRLGFVVCTALVTVPNRLLEFRYFIIPFLLWRLNLPVAFQSRKKVIIEIALFTTINLITVLTFLHRPFNWSHERGPQRFMW